MQTTVKLISDKQLKFIRDLIADRDWSSIDPKAKEIIERIQIHNDETDGQLPLKGTAASLLIGELLARPKIDVPKRTALIDVQAMLKQLPLSKYAIPKAENPNEFVFYEIRKARNTGNIYLNRLQGAPGDWHRIFISVKDIPSIVRRIAEDPWKAACMYAELYTRCSCCDSPLSNAVSIAEAMGPVCRKRFK